MRASFLRLSPLLLAAIALGALGLLLLPGPFDAHAKSGTGKVTFGLGSTGDSSVSLPQAETVIWQQFQPGAQLHGRVTDPANLARSADYRGIPASSWKWYRGNTLVRSGSGRDDSGTRYSWYTVVPADVGHRIRVEATYRVRKNYDQNHADYNVLGPEKTVSYTHPIPVQRYRDPKRNRVPQFDTGPVTFRIHENRFGNIGSPVTATDPDGDILTYSVRGRDVNIRFGAPRFIIDNATGQLKLAPGVTLDYETKNQYTVQVRAYDSAANNTGAETDPQVFSDATVNIEVIDVDETPPDGGGPAPHMGEAITVWEATLTAKVIVSGINVGCNAGVPAAACSTAAILSDDDFTHSGADYQIKAISLLITGGSIGRLDLVFDRVPADAAIRYLTLEVGSRTFPLSNSRAATQNFTNDTRSWSNSGLSWTAGDTVQLSLTGPPVDVADWAPTLNVGNTGGGGLGCRDGSDAECSAEGVLTDANFRYTKLISDYPGGQYTWNFRVKDLYRTDGNRRNELVLVTAGRIPDGFVLTVLDPRDSDTPRRFPLNSAKRRVVSNGN